MKKSVTNVKLQRKRTRPKYYVYLLHLPKNIIEGVLDWKAKDEINIFLTEDKKGFELRKSNKN